MTRGPFYQRIGAVFVLAWIFGRELFLSSITVARTAFAREVVVAPAVIEVPVTLRTELGIATVANLISLTPGTTSLHTNPEGTVLYVHCLDARSDAEVIAGIKSNFEHWVRKVEG